MEQRGWSQSIDSECKVSEDVIASRNPELGTVPASQLPVRDVTRSAETQKARWQVNSRGTLGRCHMSMN